MIFCTIFLVLGRLISNCPAGKLKADTQNCLLTEAKVTKTLVTGRFLMCCHTFESLIKILLSLSFYFSLFSFLFSRTVSFPFWEKKKVFFLHCLYFQSLNYNNFFVGKALVLFNPATYRWTFFTIKPFGG